MAKLADRPALSVVMPVRDGAEFLRQSLPALRASDLPKGSWELIVVDDGSRDDSADIAARYADVVERLPAVGPPAARNRGVAAASAPIIVFVDCDVCVHPGALRKIRDLLADRPDLSAVFGAYDLSPPAPGLVSQYRNLLHSYVHRRDAGEAVTFWTGLGAVRRDVLERCGGFDERERLDDVELGYRMTALGYAIRLSSEVQGTHLKRWTLPAVVMTDVFYRGIPWVRLLLHRRQPRGRSTLNVRGLDRLLTGLTGIGMAAGAAGLITHDVRWAIALAVIVVLMIVADGRFLRWLAAQRGWFFMLRAIPLRLLYFALNVVSVSLALLPLAWRRPQITPLQHVHRPAAGQGWATVPSRERAVADVQPPG